MTNRYIGLYWTLPVNWAGFRDLPTNVEAAGQASRTIRYQRECARRYINENHGILVDEIAFMDIRPDRATDTVRDVLRQRLPAYAGMDVALLAVAFDEVHQWRHNPFLMEAAQELGRELVTLPPTPIVIDGRSFDPARHFSAWRKADSQAMTRLRLEAYEGLNAALVEIPEQEGRWRLIAQELNGRGTRTIRGGQWTPENVRKLAGRLPRESS